MRRVPLERSLHILGPVLGRKRGVNVKIGGNLMCTDGNTVFLPSLPVDDFEASVIGFGGLFHETNHVRYTDFNIPKGPGLLGALTNALEDIRIDRLGYDEYPGGKQEEERLIEVLLRRNEAKQCQPGDHPATVLENYLMWRLEHEVLGIQAARDIAQGSERLFRSMFPPGFATKLDALMFSVRECRATSDVADLARRIVDMIEVEAKAEDAARAHSGEEPEADNQSGAQPEPTADPGPPDAGNHQKPGGVLRRVTEAQEQDHVALLGDMISHALQEKQTEAGNDRINMPIAENYDVENEAAAEGGRFDTKVRQATNALLQKIAGLLQAATMCRHYPAVSGTRLDARRLYRIPTGGVRVFKRELQGLRTETAVQVVLDRSTSMNGKAIELARESCFASGLAMQAVQGVTVGIAAFPGVAGSQVVRVSGFNENIARNANRFAMLSAGGGTPMAEAMLWGGSELLRQCKPRRILLVITDGEYDARKGRSMVDSLAAAGVETIGIGIDCEVSHLFLLSRVIHAVTELPAAMFALLLQAMKGRRPH